MYLQDFQAERQAFLKAPLNHLAARMLDWGVFKWEWEPRALLERRKLLRQRLHRDPLLLLFVRNWLQWSVWMRVR